MENCALKILVVGDNDSLRQATLALLQDHGHFVRGVRMANDIDTMIGGVVPDVYVIDLHLTDEHGLHLTRQLRAAQPKAGIVITTDRKRVGDKVIGYESGADLYLTKPVPAQELSAGVAAVGKRLRTSAASPDAVTLDLTGMWLSGPDGSLALTAIDALILATLARAPGQRVERWRIAQIMGSGGLAPPAAATLEMRITRLRKKLMAVGAPSPQIKALYKVGYSLCCSVLVQ